MFCQNFVRIFDANLRFALGVNLWGIADILTGTEILYKEPHCSYSMQKPVLEAGSMWTEWFRLRSTRNNFSR